MATSKASPRLDWYQNSTTVDISFFVKNIDASTASVEFTNESLRVEFTGGDGLEYQYEVSNLAKEIVPENSSWRVFGTKLEVELAKLETGISWKGIEKTDSEETVQRQNQIVSDTVPTAFSSKKNWSELDLDDEEDNTNVDQFFKKLYADADDETRRAMMKSFVESNGTALSTDWTSVSKGKVETAPPDGMESKKW
ncbi:unnamed protein product [Kuraishia capsulata CBS 1993]|uniref:CS domain-containing protein n=1 Tax=Kuraishia capsulata CBS 1993 TaxID=1382522 RepID=W6MTP8_9ASCO|nr:uncharacterized protein KUCA_T00005842001 [Kuraishia capsulata CBS 1993]CDK29848.1 unnamed protein product [Kuraishia capsulata CBS 1993]